MKKLIAAAMILSLLGLAGCAVNARESLFDVNTEAQLKLRQMQTRYFDTSDKKKALQAVMATLQDFGFVIDKASLELGSVTATKYNGYRLKMTVNAFPRGKKQLTVRANAQYNIKPIENPLIYQKFFDALSKSLFLQAHLEE